MHHTTGNGGTTCEFDMARRISEHGYDTKVYYPYGHIVSGIYDKFANLEDVNDDTVAIYCAHAHGNPLNAKTVVRWVAYGLDDHFYKSFADTDIIYYHVPFCKNNLSTQRLFACFLSPNVKNRFQQRDITLSYTLKKGRFYNRIRNMEQTGVFPHSYLLKNPALPFLQSSKTSVHLDYDVTMEYCIDIFNRSKYFFCYDPCTFLLLIALLCGCIVVQDPVEGYTEEEWMYAVGIPTKLKGFAYGIENIGYAEATIGDAYGPCMEIVNQSDKSIKKFLHEMETKTYNTDRCYEYEESPFSMMFKTPNIKSRGNIEH